MKIKKHHIPKCMGYSKAVVVWGKLIPVSAYIKKEKRFQINNLNLYHKELEKT